MAEYFYSDDVFTTPMASEGGAGYEVSNHEMNLAWRLIANTGTSVFLTGKAGTGKTTFLHKLRELLPKRMVVLAPTGVAAINAQGQTIHSFFQLPFGPITPGTKIERSKNFKMSKDKKNIIRTLDLLVIDEISMVRADLLDAIDGELRKYKNRYKPFGGVQLLLIGDLQQLAPVAVEREWELLRQYYRSPYFFHSLALQQIPYVTVELKHIYRQRDREFIDLLGQIRNNALTDEALSRLNARVRPGFRAPEGEDWIRLTTHNRMADDYNQHMLNVLDTPERVFTARVDGNFPESIYPADEELTLKEGAQVMFIKNDPSGQHQYYNGKIGVVREFTDEGILVYSKEDDRTVLAPPVEWENTKYTIDAETAEIKETVEGRFRQVPLRLAWAITVHKSQGLTFDHAVLDINSSFAHGQTYVALSRCRSLEGLVLTSPLSRGAIINDSTVRGFIEASTASSSEVEGLLPRLSKDYFLQLLQEAFDFRPLVGDLRNLLRILREHAAKQYPEVVDGLSELATKADSELVAVSDRFAAWCRSVVGASADPVHDDTFQNKVKNGCRYYLEKMEECASVVKKCIGLRLANKQVVQQINNALLTFRDGFRLKVNVLKSVEEEGFNVKGYLTAKARGCMEALPEEEKTYKKKPKAAKVAKSPKAPMSPKIPTPSTSPKAPTLPATPEEGKAPEEGEKGFDLETIRVHYESAYMPWGEEEDKQLLDLFDRGVKKSEIARQMGRSPVAIGSRIKKLRGEDAKPLGPSEE